MTFTPRPVSSETACFTPSSPRAQSATLAPSATKRSATARPIPRLPPVTTTLRPVSCRSIVLLSRRQPRVQRAVEVVQGQFVAAKDERVVGPAGQAALDAERRLVVLVPDHVEV